MWFGGIKEGLYLRIESLVLISEHSPLFMYEQFPYHVNLNSVEHNVLFGIRG